jgi:anti-sigma regulatory factor (Ser/Thr protein kinase)
VRVFGRHDPLPGSSSPTTSARLGPEAFRRTVSTSFASIPASVSVARAWTVDQVHRQGGSQALIERVELLVSELVTNAVQHTASTRVTVKVKIGPRSYLEVSVHDHDRTVPHPKQATPWDYGGRGLLLVEQLSDSWGTELDSSGKWVWFRVTPRTQNPKE